ncbi:MAG: 5'-nucleotidase C-terminal domain-containing protein [Eubacterium sp.]|nr:5'-nucleotidase C-terminal domain-containing protein [Eubacterium sp.]
MRRSIFFKIALSLILAVLSVIFIQMADMQAATLSRKNVPNTKSIVKTKDKMSIRFSGAYAPKASDLTDDKIESYEILYKDKEVLDVKYLSSNPVGSNGYFQAEFALPGTKKMVFLTGLTSDNVQKTQDALINSYSSKTDFDLEDLDFIDAEKIGEKGVDSDLCWAGQASDMLEYAGWIKKAGFTDEDDAFDLFSDHFNDKAGNAFEAIHWFFNGTSDGHDVKNFKPGAFLPQYPSDKLVKLQSISVYDTTPGKDSTDSLLDMTDSLRAGNAIGLDVKWLSDGEVDDGEGHAICLYGYIYNTSYDYHSLKYYDAMIIADPDSDKNMYADRRDAPNKLHIYHTKPFNKSDRHTLLLENYSAGAVINQFTSLTPYSDDLPYEKDPKATKNCHTSPDLSLSDIMLSTSPYSSESDSPTIASDKDVYVSFSLANLGEVLYNNKLSYNIQITDETGKKIDSYSEKSSIRVEQNEYNTMTLGKAFSALSEGIYTITVTLDSDSSVRESYYLNNTLTQSFEVKKTNVDTSKLSITLSVDEFKNNYSAEGKITYTNKDYIYDNNFEQTLSLSYLRDGKWSQWFDMYDSKVDTTVYGSTGNSHKKLANKTKNELPDTIDIDRDGTKVMLRLKLYSADGSPAYIFSEPVDLKYLSMTVEDLNLDKTFSKLPTGATSLVNSESIDFKIINNSTYDGGALTASYYIVAANYALDTSKTIVPETSITLGYGKDSGRRSITGWDKNIPLEGKNEIYLMLKNPVTKSEEQFYLCTLEARETPSSTVTLISDTTDNYDGRVTLREAISYIENGETPNKTITFDKDFQLQDLHLDNSIEINGDIKIDGLYKKHGYRYATYIECPTDSIFVTNPGSRLTINGLKLSSIDAFTGGSIRAEGSTVNVSNCSFANSYAQDFGGAIYAKKSTVLIKNSQFIFCSADNGSAVYSTDNSNCQILNCLFFKNSGTSYSIVENDNSSLDIVSSTFVENDAFEEGSATVKNNSSSKTTILNSILTGNTVSYEADGNINILTSNISKKIGTDVTVDDASTNLSLKKLYKTEYGEICNDDLADPLQPEETTDYALFKKLHTKKMTGSIIKSGENTVMYSEKGTNYIDSSIPVLFDAADYAKDMYGDTRGAVYGCDTTEYKEPAVGYTPVALNNKQSKGKPAEIAMGKAVSDAFLLLTKADMSFVMTGSVKAALKKGDVTRTMLNKVIPPDTLIYIKTLKGKEIKKALEISIDYMVKAAKNKKNNTKTLQIGGAVITYKASAKKGKRIKSIKINGKKIKDTKKYKVAMDYYTAESKQYKKFGKTPSHFDSYFWDSALIKYLNKSKSYIKKSVKKARYVVRK